MNGQNKTYISMTMSYNSLRFKMQARWYYLCSVVNAEVGWGKDLVTLQVMAKEMHLILVIQGLGIQTDL